MIYTCVCCMRGKVFENIEYYHRNEIYKISKKKNREKKTTDRVFTNPIDVYNDTAML